MRLSKRITAMSLSVMMAMSVCPATAWAYGETSDKSTLITDTQGTSGYQTWSNDWDTISANSGNIILTPGKTATDLNFAWYSVTKGTPAVKISKNSDMSDAKIVEGTATDIDRTNQAGNNYKSSNKVSIENYLTEETQYYYCYTDDSKAGSVTWSDTYSYKTQKTSSFQTILVGDPQIGASGNASVDAYNWNKTISKALQVGSNASFIISVGDQIDCASDSTTANAQKRETEYAGFTFPSVLRNTPISTVIGNHESLGEDYDYHYNNPNSEDGLGSTTSGSDYYYSYGDVLFIVLNSNNRNAAEHAALMTKAVESHSDAKWKIVMFHHDIYGAGQPHSDVDGANLRTIFAPLMDEFDIDVCLTGHDHSYARSYQIIDGTAIEYDNNATNPEGTLYIAAGSASGSKFYNLNTTMQYYLAERSNTQLPTFSTIDFTATSFTIKTYDYNGSKYADDFTINKSADVSAESVLSVLESADKITADDYTSESYKALSAAISNAKNLLKLSAEDTGAAALIAAYDKTILGNNAADPVNYYAYAQGDYAAEGSTRLKSGFSALLDKTYEDQVSISAEDYTLAYNALVAAVDGLVLKEEATTVVVEDVTTSALENETTTANGITNETTTSGDTATQTGDVSGTLVLLLLMMASIAVVAGGAFITRKTEKQ